MITSDIKVEIYKIRVGFRNYSFGYKVIENGNEKSSGKYEGRHDGTEGNKAFRKILEEGLAVKLAVGEAFDRTEEWRPSEVSDVSTEGNKN